MINAWFKFEGLKLSRSQGITQMMTQTTTVPKTICLSTVGGDINIHVDLTSQSNHKQERLKESLLDILVLEVSMACSFNHYSFPRSIQRSGTEVCPPTISRWNYSRIARAKKMGKRIFPHLWLFPCLIMSIVHEGHSSHHFI